MRRLPFGVALFVLLVAALAAFVVFSSLNATGQQTARAPSAAYPLPSVTSTFNPPPFPLTPNPFPSPLPPPPLTPRGTPLPTPPPDATNTSAPTLIPSSPIPMRTITAWLSYTNTAFGYSLSYPDTWFLQAGNLDSVYLTSFQLKPSGGGGIPRGSVKIDIQVDSQSRAANLPVGKQFCVGAYCGTRFDQQAPFQEPASGGLNRVVYIQIPKAGKYYQITAMIAEPADAAQVNAAIVEQIIASLRIFSSTSQPAATPLPAATSAAAAWTPIPPVVSSWTTFTGKSGFSFSYPAGWFVNESAVGVHLPENQPAVTISLLNYDTAKLPPKTAVVPGALAIQLLDFTRGEIPANGAPFTVGSQKLPGLQLIYTRDDPRVEPQFRVFERAYSIYFTAGGRRWVISAAIYPPKEGVEINPETFYRIVGSLRYEGN